MLGKNDIKIMLANEGSVNKLIYYGNLSGINLLKILIKNKPLSRYN